MRDAGGTARLWLGYDVYFFPSISIINAYYY